MTPCHVWQVQQGCDLRLTSALCVVQILNDSEARFNSADLNIAYKMDVAEYQRLCPYSESLEANWGKAPGMSILQLPGSHNMQKSQMQYSKQQCMDQFTCTCYRQQMPHRLAVFSQPGPMCVIHT